MPRRPLFVARIAFVAGLIAFAFAAGTAMAALPDGNEQQYEEALARFNEGEYETAVIHLRNALKENPRNLSARVLLGRTYLEIGDAASAETELKRARQAGAGDLYTLVPLARAYLMQREHEKIFREIQPGGRSADLEAEIRMVHGEAHLELREYPEARQAFAEASALRPEDPEPLLGQARVEIAVGNMEKAAAWVADARTLDPNIADAWFLAGEIARYRGDPEAAVAHYARALEIDADHTKARTKRAGALTEVGRLEEALEDLRIVRADNPLNAEAAYLEAMALGAAGDAEGAEKALTEAGVILEALDTQFVETTPSILLLRGVVAYLRNETDAAFHSLNRFVTQVPYHIQARKLLAKLMLRRGEPDNAVALLEPVADRHAGDAQFLMILGSAYLRVGEHGRAVDAFERAAKLVPDFTSARTALARARMMAGQDNLAVDELETVLARDPAASDAATLLALARLREGRYGDALSVARSLLERDSENAFAHNLAGGAQVGLGNLEAARASFERALAIDPRYDSAQFNLAKLDRRTGDIDAARSRYLAMAERANPSVQAMVALADLEADAGRIENAIPWLDRASYAAPEAIDPKLRLVDLYLAAGEELRAVDVARRARDLAPTNLRVREVEARAELANGRTDLAVEIYRRMGQIAREDRSTAWLDRVARLQMAVQDFEGAELTLEQALDYENGSLTLNRTMAEFKAMKGDLDAALEWAEGIRQAHPDSPEGDVLVGDFLRRQDRHYAAVAAYTRAFEKAPTSRHMLRLYHARRSAGDTRRALDDLEAWVEENPNDGRARRALAAGYIEAGRVDRAVEAHEALLETSPNDPALLNNLALLYLQEADPRARQFAERAYSLAPQHPATMDTLGWILVREGEAARGLTLLREAEVRAPGEAQVRYHMAVALRDLGRFDEARRKLEQALSAGRPFEGAQEARLLLEELKGS